MSEKTTIPWHTHHPDAVTSLLWAHNGVWVLGDVVRVTYKGQTALYRVVAVDGRGVHLEKVGREYIRMDGAISGPLRGVYTHGD